MNTFIEGDGSFAGLLEKIGGKMTREAFDLVLKKLDLHVSVFSYSDSEYEWKVFS